MVCRMRWAISFIDQSIIHAASISLFLFTWTHYAITQNEKVFYWLFPLCCFFLYAGFQLTVKYRYFHRLVTTIGLFVTFNNLMDDWGHLFMLAHFPAYKEYIFNPYEFQANEYIICSLLVIQIVRKSGWYQHYKRNMGKDD